MKLLAAPSTLRASLSAPQVRRVSWLKWALPVMVFLVLLSLAANFAKTLGDFSSLNERTARRLETLASAIALRVEDRAKVVDQTFLAVGDAIETGALSDKKLRQIAMHERENLGNVSIAVLDSDNRVLASSIPHADLNDAWLETLRGATVKLPAIAQPVHHESRWDVLFIREHRGKAGMADMRIVVAVPVDQGVVSSVRLPPGTTALVRNPDDRVIGHYPSTLAVENGSVYPVDGLRTNGPTPSTYYAISAQDGRKHLKTMHGIAVGDSGEYWELELGYAVDEYRAPWLHSLYLALLGMTIEFTLLVAGVVMLRREKRLLEQIETWSGFVSTIVRNIPTPIALVSVDTGKIALANEGLSAIFGPRAQVGERFSTLFANPSNWTDSGVWDNSEPMAMLTSAGPVQMIVRCTRLLDHTSEAEGKGLVLVTLLDVSKQCAQIIELRTEADFDALTKLPNRRNFIRASERAVAHARQGGGELAVLAVDLDHFKRVNDTWGHAAGDRVLEVVAERIRAALRDRDFPARVGGEEFAVILQGATSRHAHSIAERIRCAVAGTPIALGDGQSIRVTMSIGIATYRYGEPDLAAAQARADKALYYAKASGRNRVAADDELSACERDARETAP